MVNIHPPPEKERGKWGREETETERTLTAENAETRREKGKEKGESGKWGREETETERKLTAEDAETRGELPIPETPMSSFILPPFAPSCLRVRNLPLRFAPQRTQRAQRITNGRGKGKGEGGKWGRKETETRRKLTTENTENTEEKGRKREGKRGKWEMGKGRNGTLKTEN